MRRGGIDPVRVDRRPLGVIMGDEIPEQRWQRELSTLQRAGYADRQDYLADRSKHAKK